MSYDKNEKAYNQLIVFNLEHIQAQESTLGCNCDFFGSIRTADLISTEGQISFNMP